MSGRLVGEILQDRLEDAPVRQRQGLRAVLVVLAEAAGPDATAWPSNATIADRALLSERQVVRLLHALVELGRIVAVDGRSGGRGRTTRWRLVEASERAEKGDMASPNEQPERVTRGAEKGDTQMSPEPYEPLPPLPPHHGDRPPVQAPAAPSLPGLGRGEEGIATLGGRSRAAGRAGRRDRGVREAEERRRIAEAQLAADARHARLVAEVEASTEAARSPESLAARDAALAATAVGREVLRRRAVG